jgi:HD superfamily phosphohydrolase
VNKNEWYDPVHNCKIDENLTWSQLAARLHVSESVLRDKDHTPSAKIVTRIRRYLPSRYIPTSLRAQADIFTNQSLKEHDVQVINPNESGAPKDETDMTPEQYTKPDNSDSQLILSEEEAESFLIPHEYVRDPIHNDIWITALERELIDTPAFQRLRNLKQLGPTDLVYPGAVHTRFLHSIGTLSCAEQLVQIVNRNHDIYDKPQLIKVGKYQNLLIRVCALLHDLAHMPFGHILEREGHLREKAEWEDKERVEKWLGDTSRESIASKLKSFLKKSGISESKAVRFVQDIRRYLVPPDNLMDLEYPFIVDIVGNTLCADLLDYLDRDMYYCGLRERSGDRVVKYLAIVRTRELETIDRQTSKLEENADNTGKGRVVLLAYRIEREHVPGGGQKTLPKLEIHSEAIDLLRRRYALAEKVYFHRTKIAASAMLISATANASVNWNEVFSLSDEAFLSKLAASNNTRTKYLIKKYNSRKLYKVVYEIKYRPRSEDQDSLSFYEDWYPQYIRPTWRTAKEKEIEEITGLPEGSVVIYCPELKMNLKPFKMLVQNHPGDEIKPLEDILDGTLKMEMDAINKRFEQLWKAQILVDPDALDVFTPSNRLYDVNKICEEVMGFPNERADLDLKGKGRPSDDQIAWRVIKEYKEKHQADLVQTDMTDMFDRLVEASRRTERSSRIEQCRKTLEAFMKSSE